MALIKLPKYTQTVLCASSQINTFKGAIEELVYNALDAGSTSIAIRIHIQDSTIQVLDNGSGILKADFQVLGQKYMTSKTKNLSTLKSAAQKYGYKGKSLANIIAVSKNIKVTSRYKDSEETWEKIFHNGKSKKCTMVPRRPSQGTTLEVKGFLYNLNIQKKKVNKLNELQDIKKFLEQLSLVFNNISLSLRDDSNNEIIFKIHKKRDIYQTLSSLYNINRDDVQELQVEKNSYKVKGLIGKKDKEINRNWVYLNGKFIHCSSILHKMINENFKKYLFIRNTDQKKTKPRNNNDEDYTYIKNNIPFYFIFITCPYIDYEISFDPKRTLLEFRNWVPINKLLEKLVIFYTGDGNLKKVLNPKDQPAMRNLKKYEPNEETRKHVKEIMDKILGKNSKSLGVPQLQNGIKGKLINRKMSKKSKDKDNYKLKENTVIRKTFNTNGMSSSIKKGDILYSKNIRKERGTDVNQSIYALKNSNAENLQATTNIYKGLSKKCKTQNMHLPKKWNNTSTRNIKNHRLNTNILNTNNKTSISIEKRSRIIAERAETFLQKNNTIKRIRKKLLDKQRSRIKSVKRECNTCHIYNVYKQKNIKEKSIKTTYDLVQTILNSQQENKYSKSYTNEKMFHSHHNTKYESKTLFSYTNNEPPPLRFTFESHNYETNDVIHTSGNRYCLSRQKHSKFISKHSDENFIIPNKIHKHQFKRCNVLDRNKKHFNVNMKQTIEESLYTIEFSKSYSNKNLNVNNDFSVINHMGAYEINYAKHKTQTNYSIPNYEFNINPRNTYTISTSDFHCNVDAQHNILNMNHDSLESIENCNNIFHFNEDFNDIRTIIDQVPLHREKNMNVVFISKSQNSDIGLTYTQNVNPLNICKAIVPNTINEHYCLNNLGDQIEMINSLHQNITNLNSTNISKNEPNIQIITSATIHEDVSHKFNIVSPNFINNINTKQMGDEITKEVEPDNENTESERNKLNVQPKNWNENFDFKNRLRFLPKGMSQIFKICNTKTTCDYNLDDDYFAESLYKNFANDVEANTDIYEPKLQDIKEIGNKGIQKLKFKVKKDNASLIFDGKSLKEAKVLGQVDGKFIAAVLRNKCYQSDGTMEYLILFDQHAVHERIRLENNLAEYLIGEEWKSIPLDNIILMMSEDEVLYLHNYKNKFSKLGLEYTLLVDNEVAITAIPEAILGKNPREVEKVIKAVKNLIIEVVNMIKFQKGCVSLYPKSIMDLVFSEACRYAIKFGDKLCMSECIELLQTLADCKTPFQCAHGRPVMAVLMDIKRVKREFKIDLVKVKEFKLRR